MNRFIDSAKISLFAMVIGTLLTLILGFASSALAALQPVFYILLAAVTLFVGLKLPKEADTFAEFIVILLMIVGLSGVIGMFLPFPQLQWANIISGATLLLTIATALISLGITKQFVE